MPQFTPVCKTTDIPAGSGKPVVAGGVTLAVFNINGAFHAIGNTCPHRGGPLGDGSVSGTVVTCPWHGFAFDCTTGENAEGRPMRVASYKTRLQNGMVEIEL
ncbi:MAG: Rieske (2Fe-2S) protein [Planctomycetota bacterium]